MVAARQAGAIGASRVPAATPRTRKRFSRTITTSRWDEYLTLLELAQAEGYAVVSLEQWLGQEPDAERTLILRHDVDQCPRSVLRMLRIEVHLGVRSTWYFRWRTARPRVVRAVQRHGAEVGLHYECLSRLVLAARDAGENADVDELIPLARRTLKRELTAWSVLFGPSRSACAHGDTRVAGVNNAALLRDADLGEYGLEYDANASMRTRDLAYWLTDRSKAEGGWRDGLDAAAIIAEHASPVLLLTHPNNWISGPGLWADRLAAKLLPEPRITSRRALRTGSDEPPVQA